MSMVKGEILPDLIDAQRAQVDAQFSTVYAQIDRHRQTCGEPTRVASAKLETLKTEPYAKLDDVLVDEAEEGRGLCKLMIYELVKFYVESGGRNEITTRSGAKTWERPFFVVNILSPTPVGARKCYLRALAREPNNYVHAPFALDGLYTHKHVRGGDVPPVYTTFRLDFRSDEESEAYYGERWNAIVDGIPGPAILLRDLPPYTSRGAVSRGDSTGKDVVAYGKWEESLQFYVKGYQGTARLKIDGARDRRELVANAPLQLRWRDARCGHDDDSTTSSEDSSSR